MIKSHRFKMIRKILHDSAISQDKVLQTPVTLEALTSLYNQITQHFYMLDKAEQTVSTEAHTEAH